MGEGTSLDLAVRRDPLDWVIDQLDAFVIIFALVMNF